MAIIDNQKKICTHINVFTVAPEKHLALYEALKKATENVIRYMPGHISTNIHVSSDKTTITNYAQWATIHDFKNMEQNERVKLHLEEAVNLASEYKPSTYDTIWCG